MACVRLLWLFAREPLLWILYGGNEGVNYWLDLTASHYVLAPLTELPRLVGVLAGGQNTFLF